MRTLNEVLEDVKSDTTKIGVKPPKIQTLEDVKNTTFFSTSDIDNEVKNLAPVVESDLGNRISAGFDRGVQDLKNIAEGLQIYGGQALMSIGGFFDSGELVSRGRELIKSAYGELQADEKKFWESSIQLSDKDLDSFGYGLGQGIANYGSMLAVGYLSPIAGIGLGTALEVGQKAEEKIGYHIEETGDSELNKYTSQKAQKDTLYTTIYGVGSAIIEKKFGLGEQLKLVKMPITSKLKHVIKTAVSEGGTETLQELFATGLDWRGGYIDSSKLPERFMGAVKEGAIGAVLGGGMGVASAINHRSQAKAILREQLKNTVPEKDLDNVVDGIYESANDSMTSVVAQELIQSESLRNKHGALYNQILQEINKQIEDVGAFSQYTEAQRSQYAITTAKMFADQVLGEANKRGVVIDEVVKASEIVYKDGRLYLQGASKKTKLKRLKSKTPSLLQFIRSKGGVIDEGGELKQMDASKQYIGLVNKNGIELDTMGEALWEAGYFAERPTVSEVLDYIDDELRGVKHYPLGYVEQKGISQAENEAMLNNAISEYAEVMEYDISKMSFEEKQQIYEQMQRNLFASEEPIVEGEEVVEDFGFTDNEFFQSDNIYYQTEDGKDLVVSHATTLDKLEEALELGAMPMPSLAVTKAEYAGKSNFGEIVFVGGSNIVDPNRDVRNKTFTADIYSTRKVSPTFEITKEGVEYITRQTGNISKQGSHYWVANISYDLERGADHHLKEIYLASKGKITDLDASTYSIVQSMTEKEKADFSVWKRKFINEYTDKKIFEGFTPSGNRKFAPYDLKNILRIMQKQNLKGSESTSGGNAHALRGIWAKELKSIEEIRKEKGRIVDEQIYQEMDNVIWDETTKLSDLLVSEKKAEELEASWIAPDEYMINEALSLIKPSSNIQKILEKADLRSDKKAVDAVKRYIKLVNDLPVKYFESKPQRAVDFSEFKGVIMPESSEYNNVARELEDRGLLVLRTPNYIDAMSEFEDIFFQITNLPKQEKKIKGSFDALTKSIKITSEADFSTYQHEFAHFWLDNIWNYVNSGMASEKYIKEFNAIKKWLGVKGNYPTRSQHEKFARAYEKYLYKSTNADAPIGQAFKDYENFIREVYSSIAEIDTRAGLKYRAVPKLVYDFFNSMTSGTLPFYGDIEEPEKEVKKEVKEVKEFVAEETKILEENRANYNLKPVQTDTQKGYLTAYEKMTGEKVEAGAVNLKEDYEKAQRFVAENQEQAKRIVEGLEQAPEGMLKNNIYNAYNELQKKLGNTQNRVTSMLNQAMELRRYGQEIVSQKIAYADDTSPLYWIRTVQQNKVEALADASGLKVSELNDKISDSIKAGMKEGKSAKDIAKELRNELGVTELFQEEVYPTNETDVASYNYIYKYVNEQLGLSMSMAEAETITRKADDMLASLENSMAKNGNPSVDFFVKQKELENYANSLAPSSNARVIVSVVGRGNLLTSIKSPFTNIENNMVVGILRAITRRIKLGSYTSIVSPELIKENKQYSYEIWKKTGYNVNNITPETPRNTILGEKITHSEGDGAIRYIGKLYEKYVYKWGLGWGDVKSKDFAFTDYVALKATKLANGDVNKANAIFKDACLIDPQTDEGKEIRQEAIQESLISTYQNKGLLSDSLLKYREGLSFGVGFGEFLVPFVKTPANVKSMELKTGFGLLKAIPHEIIKDVKAVYRIKKENPNKSLAELMKTEDFKKAIKPLEKNIELVIQNSLGLAVAWAIASALDDDDYMPSYAFATSKDKQLAKELNIPFNAIKIGNTWISLDYFGALASPLVGWLQARREESLFAYFKTAGVQVASLPGLGNIADLYQKVEGLAKKSKDEVISETGDALMEQLYARSIPAIVSDFAKALDSYERETKGNEIITKIPVLREIAPEKISVTSGKAEELGNPIYDILFGSRVKEQVSNDVADELQRLNNVGWGVSLTTVTRSGLLSELDDNTKQKVREDFAEEYSKQVKRLIKTPRYKRLSDEDKQESINKIRRSIVERLKKRYLKKRKK